MREHRAQRSKAKLRAGTALTDTILMSSRDGITFHLWNDAFIRPGPERPGTWSYGHLFTACGMVQTAPQIKGMPDELSLYSVESSWTGDENCLRRYTLRTDGFASVFAPSSGGELRTKPLIFGGKELFLNFATSANGFIKVVLHDLQDQPIEGFRYNDSNPIFGDSLNRKVTWKTNRSPGQIKGGGPVKLRIILKDADLYSLQFR